MNSNGSHNIPFLDLVAVHREIESELMEVFRASIQTAGFIGGPLVENFEREFADFCGSNHCIGVGSGTDALRFALIAAGVKDGEIVVTVPLTFIATTEAISQAGARPAFVDINPESYTMDVTCLRKYLEEDCVRDTVTGKCLDRASGRAVTAVIPVHLYGQTVDMDPILDLAEQYHLLVIEDACQAHGAEYFSRRTNRWLTAGSMGHAAAFSFYPGKNLGACGEGGAVTTNDVNIAQKVAMLRDHGQAQKYYHDVEGYNGRLDAIQAGILRVKLKGLGESNNRRRAAAERYDELFSSLAVITPPRFEWSRPVHHVYVARVKDREALQSRLSESGIGTGIHYPVPLHLQKAYESLNYKRGDFPVAEAVASEVISLPMYPHLTSEQQQRVAAALKQFTPERSFDAHRDARLSPVA